MFKKLLLPILLALPMLLSAEDVAPMPPERSFWHTFTMLALAGIMFYFILFRPEQKRRKQVESQRSQMKKGDRVTAMGIIGTIAKIQDETVIVRMYDGSKIEFVKGAITEVVPGVEEIEREP